MVAMVINSSMIAKLRAERPPPGSRYVTDWWEAALFYVLGELDQDGERGATITELARVLGAVSNGSGGSGSTLHVALLRLRHHGLVITDADPWTARHVHWRLTVKGRELLS